MAEAVERHSPMVRATCRRILGARHPSFDDACQSAFVALLERSSQLRDRAALPAWLHRAAIHACHHVLRDERRRRARELVAARQRPEPLSEVPDGEHGPLAEAIDTAIESLPRAQRDAVILCHLEGVPQQAAAKALGCSHGALRKRLSDASVSLRSRLERHARKLSASALLTCLADECATAAVDTTVSRQQTLEERGVSDAARRLARRTIRSIDMPFHLLMTALSLVGLSAVAGIGLLALEPPAEPPAPPAAAAGGPMPVASELDEGSALFARLDAAHACIRTISGTITWRVHPGDSWVDGLPHGVARRTTVAYASPGFSTELVQAIGDAQMTSRICGDGAHWWSALIGTRQQYYEGSGHEKAFPGPGSWWSLLSVDPRALALEFSMTASERADGFLLTLRHRRQKDWTRTLTLDRELHPTRIEDDSPREQAIMDVDLTFNRPIPADAFTFVPPADAERVASPNLHLRIP